MDKKFNTIRSWEECKKQWQELLSEKIRLCENSDKPWERSLADTFRFVQVPHHGVKGDNHNINLYRAIKTCLISVKDNDPKHPTTKVKADIISQGGNYLKVTDKSQKVIFNYSV